MQHCEYIAVYRIFFYRSCYRNNNIVKHFFFVAISERCKFEAHILIC